MLTRTNEFETLNKPAIPHASVVSVSISSPQIPVERAVLNGLGEVFDADSRRIGEVGDGARDFEDAVVGARAELQLAHREAEHFLARGVEPAVSLELGIGHLGVRPALAAGGESLRLFFAGRHHPFTNCGGRLGALVAV